MHYGLMTYTYKGHLNVGDYIQSLAARQFLPRVDRYINREKLSEYSGPKTKLIMNGWFMHNPKNWPPSPDIVPLFISFHIHKKAAAAILNQKGVSYLKKYEVGTRDHSTLNLLKAKGINAFFSGCLTLTLGNSFQNKAGTDILFVDVLHKPSFIGRRKRILRKLFDDKITRFARWITHRYPERHYRTEDSRFQLAIYLLNLYQNARLVVTSRLHCALPCLAMGTPVIFVDGCSSSDRDRLEGLDRILNIIKLCSGKVSTNFDLTCFRKIRNKNQHLKYAELLERRCKEFIQCRS
jgi:hypothetical protein